MEELVSEEKTNASAGIGWAGGVLGILGFAGFAGASVWALTASTGKQPVAWYVWVVWALALLVYLVGAALLIYYISKSRRSVPRSAPSPRPAPAPAQANVWNYRPSPAVFDWAPPSGQDYASMFAPQPNSGFSPSQLVQPVVSAPPVQPLVSAPPQNFSPPPM